MPIVNAARNHRWAVLVSLCCAFAGFALGFLVARNLPGVPPRAGPVVAVVTQYPDMPAEHVARDITKRIERWVNQADGVRRVESRSATGLSVVKVYFHNQIDAGTASTQVSSLALADLPYLPPGTAPPAVVAVDWASGP